MYIYIYQMDHEFDENLPKIDHQVKKSLRDDQLLHRNKKIRNKLN